MVLDVDDTRKLDKAPVDVTIERGIWDAETFWVRGLPRLFGGWDIAPRGETWCFAMWMGAVPVVCAALSAHDGQYIFCDVSGMPAAQRSSMSGSSYTIASGNLHFNRRAPEQSFVLWRLNVWRLGVCRYLPMCTICVHLALVHLGPP